MSEPRQFSRRQRRALYRAAGGECERCGKDLRQDWHADHVVPRSKGGLTTIANGQALCPGCNLSKSDQISKPNQMSNQTGTGELDFQNDVFGPPPFPEPLTWQKRAIREFTATDEHFLADAAPGAGKTAFAAYLFRHLYRSEWERIFVITSSRQRRGGSREGGGWIGDLNDFGIPVMENWAGRESDPTIKDYLGAAMTYHILPGNEQDLKALTQVPSLVVFDEIHHLGDQLAWGRAAKEAFGHPNAKTLGLTGTPFRSDDARIPFVEYERDERGLDEYDLVSKGHVGYTYGDALSDNVLRYVHFPTYDGTIRWRSRDGEEKEHEFSDDLTGPEQGERLRAAARSKEWTLPQIREADEKLSEIRSSKPDAAGPSDAAGLVVAMGKAHARQICEWMRLELGRDPVLVESDQKRAHDRIERFKEGDSRWIVAIQMVSEGVNIERLRVGVYASNVTTPLFIHQVIGRVLRGPEGQSWFWFPADERILGVIENIREMRDHVIEASGEKSDSEKSDGGGGGDGEPSLFRPVGAELGYYELIGPLFDEIPNMTRSQLAKVPPEVLRDYVARRGPIGPTGNGPTGDGPAGSEPGGNGPTGNRPTGNEPTGGGPVGNRPSASGLKGSGPGGDGRGRKPRQVQKPRQVRETELRGEIHRRAVRVAAERFPDEFGEGGRKRGMAIAKIHKRANSRAGIQDTDTAPLYRLEEKKQVLQDMSPSGHENVTSRT